ncbi:aspartate 1-decarboxylase [Actinophytocola gossypii]|uniref:aspartate 1-decarboxylase n=1 Tax=Actinophytocola gossypii TaxID=2812003 RepID=UPI0035CCCAA9
MNGAAAHLVHPGDLVIVITYVGIADDVLEEHRPRIVHVDHRNRIVELGEDPAGPVPEADGQRSRRDVATVGG